ncbi:MAG: ABC transporter permease [Chloroflexota bacterium]
MNELPIVVAPAAEAGAPVDDDAALPTPRGRRALTRRAGRYVRDNPLIVVGIAIVVLEILAALLAPVIAPFGPLQQNIMHRLEPPEAGHLFGTDDLGRDVFSRVLYGARVSLPLGAILVLIGGTFGTLVGAVAGYAGGWLDETLMRLTDLIFAFPTIILAMAVAAALGPSLRHSILAIVIVWWPSYARLARAMVLSVGKEEYVTAARAAGLGTVRIMLSHILRNAMGPLVVLATLDVGNAILTFSGLSFLGLGATPPTAEWGSMVSTGAQEMDQWWLGLFPGLAIWSVVLAFNLLGDGLRDALDPQGHQM